LDPVAWAQLIRQSDADRTGLAAAMADFVSEHSRDSFWSGKDLSDFATELFVLYVCIGNSTGIYYYLFSLRERYNQ
jgi:hypothetical protein